MSMSRGIVDVLMMYKATCAKLSNIASDRRYNALGTDTLNVSAREPKQNPPFNKCYLSQVEETFQMFVYLSVFDNP